MHTASRAIATPRNASRRGTRSRYHELEPVDPCAPVPVPPVPRRSLPQPHGVRSGSQQTTADKRSLGGAPAGGVLCVVSMGIADRERVRSLVEPHWRRLYNFVFRLTLDRDRAERYLRDIFVLAAAAIDRAPSG